MKPGLGTTAATTLVGPESPLLLGRTGRGVGVAVIDSGVNPSHPHVGGLQYGIAFDESASPHGDLLDRLGHGTAVTAAIHEKAPDAALHVVRVFHDRLSTSLDALLAALDWSVAREARLVNLSLGTANPENAPALEEAVARAAEAGTIVVSAQADGERVWFPGSLGRVLGVEMDAGCPRDSARFTVAGDAVCAAAAGYPRPIPGLPMERNLNGVSFAVANVTGVLARLLEGHEEVRQLRDLRRLLLDP